MVCEARRRSSGSLYGNELAVATQAVNQRDHTQNDAANKEGDKPKDGADAQSDFNARASGVLDLHQVFIDPGGMNQHVQELRARPEAEQHKQSISDITRRGGFRCLPLKTGFDIVKSAIETSG